MTAPRAHAEPLYRLSYNGNTKYLAAEPAIRRRLTETVRDMVRDGWQVARADADFARLYTVYAADHAPGMVELRVVSLDEATAE